MPLRRLISFVCPRSAHVQTTYYTDVYAEETLEFFRDEDRSIRAAAREKGVRGEL